jgi:hypothetical protein
MEAVPLEHILWQFLETASQSPEAADLRSLCDVLEQALSNQPLATQLNVAAKAFMQLAAVYAARADLLMTEWECRHYPKEPVVNLEDCVELFVQSLSLDVSDLFEEPQPVQYPANRKQKAPRTDGSVVGEIDKTALLNWVDQMATEQPLDEIQMVERIRGLAHGENIEVWSSAIAAYLSSYSNQHTHQSCITISLAELCRGMQKSLVEVWLGLLLGEEPYQIYQTSENFYDPAGIEIRIDR